MEELEARDMYLHFQETVPLGSFKTLTYLSFRDEVASVIARGLMFCEQVANESGQTRLAWLLTCLDDPPFALVEARKAPRAEVPHGQLSEPRWIAAQLGYLRDAQLIQERNQATHHQAPPFSAPAPQANPGNPKGKGKKQKAIKDGPEAEAAS